MKSFLLALVSATALLLWTTTPAAESWDRSPTAKPVRLTGSADKQEAATKQVSRSPAKRKPFTPEDVKQAEANKKKVEWWQMPKPPVPETRRSGGGSHAGH